MLKKLLLTLVIAVSFVFSNSAQTGQGTIKGKILDDGNSEPIPFANVTLFSGSDQVIGTTTDFDGKYTLKPIPPGTYDLQVSYVGYQTKRIAGISVGSGRITDQDIKVTAGVQLEEVEVIAYTKPLFEKDQTTTGETKTREEISRMAVRSATDIAKTAGNGTFSRDDGSDDINVRGSRSGANVTFIDGIKVIGSTSLPKSAIEEVSVKTGGLSAQYGDVTGGVTSITTRGALKEYFGNVEVLTSGLKTGEDEVFGLDNYGFNLFGFSAGGPLLTKKDENGKIIDAPLGFLLTGEYRTILNPRPAAVQLYALNDAKQDEIEQTPLFSDGVTLGTFKRAEFVTREDFREIDYQRDVQDKTLVLNAKIDIKINDLSAMAVGGTFNTNRNRFNPRDGRGSFQLLNSNNNPYESNDDYRVYARYTQRFENAKVEDGEIDKSLVKNAFFSLQADFSKRRTSFEHEEHRDNFFDYGYIGRFDAVTERSYSPSSGVLLADGRTYSGDFLTAFNSPIAYNFTPGEVNPLLALYTQSFYDLAINGGIDQDFYDTREDIEGGGALVNGASVNGNIYNLWSAPGTVYNLYTKTEDDQYRLSGRGSADIGDHAITLGFEYEQRVERNFSMNPLGLWQLGRGTVNAHIEQIDSTNFSIDQTTSTPQITFERNYDQASRTLFAINMRNELGLDPRGNDFIDFDSYDPSVYDYSYFSAEQLINPSNSVNLQYRGYDYLGNKISGSPSLDDFFNETMEVDGQTFNTRPISAYEPIYIAGYLEDKFSFDDLVFRLGLRLDRFDANQPVLKDQYAFLPTRNVAYAKTQGLDAPDNIGDDFVVYVDDIENPEAESVTGYRDPETNTFFNAIGEEISDPQLIRGAGGIAPWLIEPSERNLVNQMTSESFEDYEPQYTLMPRISFSFPISDEATFFANYDILTQRPANNVALDPIDIIYVQSHNRRLNNPNLKPTKTISYELGFKQKLTNSSALTLSSFYREQRDEIQVVQLAGAYPEDYLTFGNQDFGTVKGFTINYDLRRTKNVSLRINYTIQFANGTGSSTTSSLNLVTSGQPNLRSIFPYNFDQRHQITSTIDYRYGRGSKYNGPKISGKNILEDAGLNLVFIAGSGTPYTSRSFAVESERMGGAPQRAPVQGEINGSRLPWTLRMDARIDKNFDIKWGDKNEANETAWKEGKKTSLLNVYIQILNVLDRQNIRSVYAATGNAEDDGYLTSAQFQDQIRIQNNEQSYRDLYAFRLQNQFNYELPRRIRLGVSLSF